MNTNKKVWLCLLGNIITMIIVIILVSIFNDNKNGTYFRFGPYDDFILIGIKVDNWLKWSLVLFFIGLIKGCDVLVNEIGSPILGFRVYNPDCKIITDFTKNELNFLTNSMWFTNNFRSLLMIVVNISQFDIALCGVIISEFISIFTVRYLLNEKNFTNNNYNIVSQSDIEIENIV